MSENTSAVSGEDPPVFAVQHDELPELMGASHVKINYRELDHLIGRLLTLNDVFGGSEKQIRSRKTLIQRECRDWLEDVADEQKVEDWR